MVPCDQVIGSEAASDALCPPTIIGGLLRLLRERGVTLQAVAGALVIYLEAGLMFARGVSLIAQASSAPYFAHHTNG